MESEIDLPPELQSVLAAMSAQPEHARELFRYALVLLMIDDERARILGTRMDNEQEILTLRTIVGDEFEIVRPAMSEEAEAYLMQQIRKVVAGHEGDQSIK